MDANQDDGNDDDDSGCDHDHEWQNADSDHPRGATEAPFFWIFFHSTVEGKREKTYDMSSSRRN